MRALWMALLAVFAVSVMHAEVVPSSTPPSTGELRVLVVLTAFADTPVTERFRFTFANSPYIADAYQGKQSPRVSEIPDQRLDTMYHVSKKYKEMSNGKLTLRWEYAEVPLDMDKPISCLADEIVHAAIDQAPSQPCVDLYVVVFPHVSKCQAMGGASPGRVSWFNGYHESSTEGVVGSLPVIRMIGHNLGLQTSSLIGRGKSVWTNNTVDFLDQMGSGSTVFNAAYQHYLNWLDDNEVVIARENGLYRLHPLDSTRRSPDHSQTYAIVLEKSWSGHTYEAYYAWFSLTTTGKPQRGVVDSTVGITIHAFRGPRPAAWLVHTNMRDAQVQSHPSFTTADQQAVFLKPGQTFQAPGSACSLATVGRDGAADPISMLVRITCDQPRWDAITGMAPDSSSLEYKIGEVQLFGDTHDNGFAALARDGHGCADAPKTRAVVLNKRAKLNVNLEPGTYHVCYAHHSTGGRFSSDYTEMNMTRFTVRDMCDMTMSFDARNRWQCHYFHSCGGKLDCSRLSKDSGFICSEQYCACADDHCGLSLSRETHVSGRCLCCNGHGVLFPSGDFRATTNCVCDYGYSGNYCEIAEEYAVLPNITFPLKAVVGHRIIFPVALSRSPSRQVQLKCLFSDGRLSTSCVPSELTFEANAVGDQLVKSISVSFGIGSPSCVTLTLYVCSDSESYTQADLAWQVSARSRPQPVQQLRMADLSTSTVHLRWTPPFQRVGFFQLLQYVVTLARVDDGAVMLKSVVTQPEFQATDLNHSTKYRWSVVASDQSMGAGPTTNLIITTTSPNSVPSQPLLTACPSDLQAAQCSPITYGILAADTCVVACAGPTNCRVIDCEHPTTEIAPRLPKSNSDSCNYSTHVSSNGVRQRHQLAISGCHDALECNDLTVENFPECASLESMSQKSNCARAYLERNYCISDSNEVRCMSDGIVETVPTLLPTPVPTTNPSPPSSRPTATPSARPTVLPSAAPTSAPTKGCKVSVFTEWSACSTNSYREPMCGPGVRSRTRTIIERPDNMPFCPTLTQYETCSIDCFPWLVEQFRCTYTEWADWSNCSQPCGSGWQYRENSSRADNCPNREERACNTFACFTPAPTVVVPPTELPKITMAPSLIPTSIPTPPPREPTVAPTTASASPTSSPTGSPTSTPTPAPTMYYEPKFVEASLKFGGYSVQTFSELEQASFKFALRLGLRTVIPMNFDDVTIVGTTSLRDSDRPVINVQFRVRMENSDHSKTEAVCEKLIEIGQSTEVLSDIFSTQVEVSDTKVPADLSISMSQNPVIVHDLDSDGISDLDNDRMADKPRWQLHIRLLVEDQILTADSAFVRTLMEALTIVFNVAESAMRLQFIEHVASTADTHTQRRISESDMKLINNEFAQVCNCTSYESFLARYYYPYSSHLIVGNITTLEICKKACWTTLTCVALEWSTSQPVCKLRTSVPLLSNRIESHYSVIYSKRIPVATTAVDDSVANVSDVNDTAIGKPSNTKVLRSSILYLTVATDQNSVIGSVSAVLQKDNFDDVLQAELLTTSDPIIGAKISVIGERVEDIRSVGMVVPPEPEIIVITDPCAGPDEPCNISVTETDDRPWYWYLEYVAYGLGVFLLIFCLFACYRRSLMSARRNKRRSFCCGLCRIRQPRKSRTGPAHPAEGESLIELESQERATNKERRNRESSSRKRKKRTETLTGTNAVVGGTVQRGPDWSKGDQDGGVGSSGRIIAFKREDGSVEHDGSLSEKKSHKLPAACALVKWRVGGTCYYPMGLEGQFHLVLVRSSKGRKKRSGRKQKDKQSLDNDHKDEEEAVAMGSLEESLQTAAANEDEASEQLHLSRDNEPSQIVEETLNHSADAEDRLGQGASRAVEEGDQLRGKGGRGQGRGNSSSSSAGGFINMNAGRGRGRGRVRGRGRGRGRSRGRGRGRARGHGAASHGGSQGPIQLDRKTSMFMQSDARLRKGTVHLDRKTSVFMQQLRRQKERKQTLTRAPLGPSGADRAR